ncbi:hypothetical protein Tco_1234539 [Tanacetum coccineum]
MSYGKRLKLGHSYTSNTSDIMRPSKMSKLLYTRFTKLIINHFLSNNKSIPRRSSSKLHNAIKKLAGYKFYMAKKVESENAKIVDEPEEQHISPTIVEETVVVADTYAEWGQKLKGEGSSDAHNKYYDSSDNDSEATLYSSNGDDDASRCGVFMHNKSTATPNSTYLSLTVTSSLLDFIQTLLDETPANELKDFMSHPVYTDAQTTSVVHNLEGDPELTSYISGASEVPLGTHVDVLATKTLLQEMFPNENAYHFSSPPATKTSYPTTYPQPSSLQAKAKKLMQKAKKNTGKINFKKAVAQKFREYDQKLKALTNFNVSEAFEKAVQARVLTEIKKLLPTHIPKAITNYVRPRLNTSVLDNKKKRQKDVGEPSSRSSRRNKSPVIHAQADTPSMQPLDQEDEYVRKHPYPEWFPKKSGLAKRRTTWFDLILKLDINQNENHILGPSTVAIAKKLKAIIQKDELTIADLEGAGLERLKQQYQNDVELEYHVSKLKAAVLTEAKWNSGEDDVSKPRTFERHMSKNTKPHPSFYNNDFYYIVCLSTKEKYTTSITKHYAARYYKQGIEDMILDRWCKETHRYIFEALNGIHHWDGDRIDFFKAEMSTRTEGSVYLDLRIKSVVCVVVKKKWGYGFLSSIVVRRSDDKEYELSYADLPRLSLNDVEDMYLLQVQDKLQHLPLEFLKDFNNVLLLFIRRVMIQNRVEDIQLGVESYQQTLNLTKPMMFFEGIDQRIPFTMTSTHKGVVYLNQHNVKSLMNLSEVKKFCDGTLEKIRENLIDMVKKNKLGTGNKWLKGRD